MQSNSDMQKGGGVAFPRDEMSRRNPPVASTPWHRARRASGRRGSCPFTTTVSGNGFDGADWRYPSRLSNRELTRSFQSRAACGFDRLTLTLNPGGVEQRPLLRAARRVLPVRSLLAQRIGLDLSAKCLLFAAERTGQQSVRLCHDLFSPGEQVLSFQKNGSSSGVRLRAASSPLAGGQPLLRSHLAEAVSLLQFLLEIG